MIHLSTLQSGLPPDPEIPVEQVFQTLSTEDEEFYHSIKDQLDREYLQPSSHSIGNILAYSKSLKK